jgi:hypothetical protein
MTMTDDEKKKSSGPTIIAGNNFGGKGKIIMGNVIHGGLQIGGSGNSNKAEETQNSTPDTQPSNDFKWYKKPLGIIFLTVISGLIIAFVVHKVGWSSAR